MYPLKQPELPASVVFFKVQSYIFLALFENGSDKPHSRHGSKTPPLRSAHNVSLDAKLFF